MLHKLPSATHVQETEIVPRKTLIDPRVRIPIALAAVTMCVAVAVLGPDPNPYLRSAERFHDFLHVPGFGLVAAFLLFGFPYRPGATLGRRTWHVAVLFMVSVAIGTLVELLQGMLGSDPDPWDVVHDGAGAAAMLLGAASFWPAVRTSGRWGLRLAALIAAIGFAGPTIYAITDEARARREFPVLASFNRAEEIDRFEWSALASASLVRLDRGGAGQRRAVQVTFSPGEYPGFTLKYFPRDWRGFQQFVLSCTNVSDVPFDVTIRLDDMQHNEDYFDRFNRSYVLAPGRNEIVIPLAAVEAAPLGRKFDLGRVRSVMIFAYRLKASREILVESLRLDR